MAIVSNVIEDKNRLKRLFPSIRSTHDCHSFHKAGRMGDRR